MGKLSSSASVIAPDMGHLFRGILIGLLFGVPAGAVGAMTAQRAYSSGLRAGLLTGLGSSVADCLYACVGAFGLSLMLMRFAQHTVGSQPTPPATPTPTPAPTPAPTPQPTPAPEKHRLQVTVNGQNFYGEIYDNETARAFVAMLPMSLNMQELNGNEKYHYFDRVLPTNASCPEGIHTGDLMLYGNNCLVLFYKDFTTSYSYTPIGRLDDPTGLERALGSGSAQITFSSER